MGRKGRWFSSVKKAFSQNSKENKYQNENKPEKCLVDENPSVPNSSVLETVAISHPLPLEEEVVLTEVESKQTKQAYSVAVATATAAAAAQSSADVVRLTAVTPLMGKSKEEVAAIRIQTSFRGYLARRALRALRGLVRLKSLVEGPIAKRQTTNTLRCMQTISRVQSQINSRRIRLSEENHALQKQLLQKHAKELECLKIGEEWDDSLQSKEQIESSLLNKYEAAMRRERALAYSYSHQQTWKKPIRSGNLLFMDPTNPHWGWSWIERWMDARPWEQQSITEKELNSDPQSVKSAGLNSVGEIVKAYAHHQLNSDNLSAPVFQKLIHPSNQQSPSTPQSKPAFSMAARKVNPPSRRANVLTQDNDSKSISSVQSDRYRRHSISGSYIRDDESLASSLAVPSYMVATQSAKAKLRLPSPLGTENGTPEKESAASAKKRLSFPASPAKPRRHSGPPKVDCSLDVEDENNGGSS